MSIKRVTWQLFNIVLIMASTMVTAVLLIVVFEYGLISDMNILKGISVIGISIMAALSTCLLLNKTYKVFQIVISSLAFITSLMFIGFFSSGEFGLDILSGITLSLDLDAILQMGIGLLITLLIIGLRRRTRSRLVNGDVSRKSRTKASRRPYKANWSSNFKRGFNRFVKNVKVWVSYPFQLIKGIFVGKGQKIKGQRRLASKKSSKVKRAPHSTKTTKKVITKSRKKEPVRVASSRHKQSKNSKNTISARKVAIGGNNKKQTKVVAAKSTAVRTKHKKITPKPQVIQKAAKVRTSNNGHKVSDRNKRSVLRFLGLKQPNVQLAKEVEHKCPYCLEIVEKNDPRGIKVCPICHTYHHADCWEVTGTCQVPHKHE